jgi:hypothetical protein
VVEELEYSSNLESYAVGSLAMGRATLGGQVEVGVRLREVPWSSRFGG